MAGLEGIPVMGRQHVSSGVMTGALVAWTADLGPGQAAAFIPIVAVCSLLPDIDHPGAMLPRMLGWPGRMLAAFIHHVFGHRTLTHSVLGIGVLSAGMAFIPHFPEHCYWAVILGCVTHVVGDMLTVSGVPVFWPMGREYHLGWVPTMKLQLGWPFSRTFYIGRMRAGGPFERRVLTPLLLMGAAASVGLVVATSA